MNRNAEQHYAQVPRAEIRRARFKRDFNLLTTFNDGDLVPIYCDEVLPGDTAKINMNALIRMSTPLYPVMDNSNCDFYFFFVPSRLLWDHFENLMGQNDSTFWAEPVEYTTPKTKAPAGGWKVGTLADYFGIPTGVENIEVNSLPFRAYVKIYNEWFRDENVMQPLAMSTGDETTEGANIWTGPSTAEKGCTPARAAKYKDYFTSCLPSPQKGEGVKLPLNGNADVYSGIKEGKRDDYAVYLRDYTDQLGENNVPYAKNTTGTFGIHGAENEKGTSTGQAAFLYADLSSVTAATINELRQAIAVQHILERDARTGTRYKEILQGAWGGHLSGCTTRPKRIHRRIQTTNQHQPGGADQLNRQHEPAGQHRRVQYDNHESEHVHLLCNRTRLHHRSGSNQSRTQLSAGPKPNVDEKHQIQLLRPDARKPR
jgi:hypothetical protein